MRMRIFYSAVVGVALIFFICGLLSGGLSAQAPGEVAVGGTVVIRFYDDGKQDPDERAKAVSERLSTLTRQGMEPEKIIAKKDGMFYGVFWGNTLLTYVDASQAELNHTTPDKLATVWAQNIRNALMKKVFYCVPDSVNIPLKGSVVVRFSGTAKGNIVKESDTGLVNVEIESDGESARIYATDAGSSKVVFKRNGHQAVLSVKVREYAGEVPDRIETYVSGNPVPRDILVYASVNACQTAIDVKPGVKLKIGKNINAVSSLPAGQTASITVPVELLGGNNYFDVKKNVEVVVKNQGEGFSTIKKVMVSNRPEGIRSDGILFTGEFDRDEPTRVLFYHQNRDSKKRKFYIELVNPSSAPIKIMTGGVMAGPSRWGITVGHSAAQRLLEMHRDSIGYIITVPPRSSFRLLDFTVPPEQVFCGYFHLQLKEGNQAQVITKTVGENDDPDKELPILTPPFDPFKIHPKGIFTPAYIESELQYEVGQKEDTEWIVGQAPWLIDAITGEPNNGNYGIFYKLNIDINNSGDAPQQLGFFFEPMSVLAQGSFLLDGKLIETDIVRRPSRRIFAVVELKAGEKKRLNLITTPEGGSYYPVKIYVKELSREQAESFLKGNIKPTDSVQPQDIPKEEED